MVRSRLLSHVDKLIDLQVCVITNTLTRVQVFGQEPGTNYVALLARTKAGFPLHRNQLVK